MINPYLQQTVIWSNFFLSTNNSKHKIHKVSSACFDALIYQYPLFGNKVFWYIPRAFAVKNELDESKSEYIEEIKNILFKIEEQARKQKNVVHIKIDFNDLPIFSGVNAFLSQIGYKYSDRKIQYNKTKVISIPQKDKIDFPTQKPDDISIENLTYFWDKNQTMFADLMDKRTRYGVRKALQYPFVIKYKKNDKLLDDFLVLHNETAKKQRFSTFNPNYFKTLVDLDIAGIVNLYDENGLACSSWLGVAQNDVIYHLFGANNVVARKHYAQYLLHLIIMYQMVLYNIHYYDLGGLEEGKGYDLFKKGFKGDVINFCGPYDKIIDPFWFKLYNLYRYINKNILKR